MAGIAEIFAEFIYAILPDWVRLPGLTLVLPHGVYWIGLIAFPLIAMYLVRRDEQRTRPRDRVTAPIAYLLWFTAGFVGLHRFYLRAPKFGAAYVLMFVLVLYGNKRGAGARNLVSEASNALKGAEFDVERFAKALARGRDGAAAKLEQAKEALVAVKIKLAGTDVVLAQWEAFSGCFAALILIALIADFFLMGGLRARCNALEADLPPPADFSVMERGGPAGPRAAIHNPATRAIDALSGVAGNFVAYWAVVAVFVYYYEVVARYVFNSPTNWAHESMFLMFGMQYLLSGAFALREDSHVRVDVIYEMLSERAKALLDMITSIFFFVFTLTLLITGFIFSMDSVNVFEVSFTEWAIQYWPVKLSSVVGAALITLQGAAKLIRDVIYFTQQRATG